MSAKALLHRRLSPVVAAVCTCGADAPKASSWAVSLALAPLII